MRSLHVRVATGAAVIAAGTAIVKLLGACREILIARTFGAADQVDSFLVAFSVPALSLTIFGLAFQSAFIPAYLGMVERRSTADADRLLARSTVIAVLASLAVAVLLALFREPFVALVGSNFDEPKRAYTEGLFLLFLPLIPLGCVAACMTAALQAKERFLQATLVPVITPIVAIALLVVANSPSIRSLVIAIVISGLLESVVFVGLVQAAGFNLFKRFEKVSSIATNAMLLQAIPLLVYATLTNFGYVIDQAFAATQAAGSVAVFAYAIRVPYVTFAVVLAALGTAVLPTLTRLCLAGDREVLLGFLKRQLPAVFVGVAILSAVLVATTSPVIRLLFGEGAFSADELSAINVTQQWYLLQTPFLAVNIIVIRAISAVLDNRVTVVIAAVGFVANVVLDAVLVNAMGVDGIALGSSLVQAGLMPLALWIFWRKSSHRITASMPVQQ